MPRADVIEQKDGFLVLADMPGVTSATIDRLLDRFYKSAATLMAEVAASEGDAARLSDLAHKLKGAARAAGAVRLGDIAAKLEESGSSTDVTELLVEWRLVEAALGAS